MKWDKLVYTGSTVTGKKVAKAAAENLVPVLLELGGKCPVIIDKTANVEFAAKKTLFGKLTNFGQVCISADYVFCHRSLIGNFIGEMNDYLEDGFDNCKDRGEVGKIINPRMYNRLCDLMKDHGGRVSIGNKNTYKDRNLVPTVIIDPDRNAPIMK